MKLFACPACAAGLFFENARCLSCGAAVGYDPTDAEMRPAVDDARRRCANASDDGAGCNWLVAADDAHDFCVACRLNRTIPDLSVDGNLDLWRALEAQKRHMVYALLRLGLPVAPRESDPEGVAFDFLADPDPSFTDRGRVLSGHAEGLITLNIREADPAERERMRRDMDEPYRTLLGHFRHEIGHYYWERLVRGAAWLEPFRAAFGDERADYAEALERHYADGPAPDWRARHVSAYAASHPWEDWAESFAHYLHMLDTLETAWRLGLRLDPRSVAQTARAMAVAPDFDPFGPTEFATLAECWLPLTVALNSLSRSMGQGDLYPFVLAPPALAKLGFVHRVVHGMGPD